MKYINSISELRKNDLIIFSHAILFKEDDIDLVINAPCTQRPSWGNMQVAQTILTLN